MVDGNGDNTKKRGGKKGSERVEKDREERSDSVRGEE